MRRKRRGRRVPLHESLCAALAAGAHEPMLGSVSAPPTRVRDFCLRILDAGDLATKLVPPAPRLDDRAPGPALVRAWPAREVGLAMASGAGPLPRPGTLGDPAARARCLARFAHHELMAAELFAWALLRWPELPRGLRRGLLRALADEQRHCRLYLDRLAANGATLADFAPHSSYFWKHVAAVAASPAGPRAFLCAVGLTFEQANLDFALVYRDAFRAAGDEASAQVCARIHAEEIGHVALAARWLRRLADEPNDVARYEAAVPFPLGAARAKGRRFDAAARRRAGLDPAFVEHVRRARARPEAGPRRPPTGRS
jgi:uncharacterized ferritin-like protein (DUF455 family)